MTRNSKKLGIAVLAVLMLGAMASSAWAATEHEFHADGEKTILTGENVGTWKFAVGAAGTVECTKAEGEGTSTGTLVSAGTYKTDSITGTGRTSGCTFGGQPATVKENHCGTIIDSDTTEGNTDGGEHANAEVECAEGNKVEIDTSVCTITIGAQLVKHAVRFENETNSSILAKTTAKKVVVGKLKTTESQTGCLLFPTGAIGTLTGTARSKCFKDESEGALSGTERTTPQGLTKEGATTECSVK